MNATLSGQGKSSLMMLPSMVDQLPNGYAYGWTSCQSRTCLYGVSVDAHDAGKGCMSDDVIASSMSLSPSALYNACYLLFRCFDMHEHIVVIDEYADGACRFESGDFFALDMGGTNFRTVYVKLSDKHGKMVCFACPCMSS